MISDTVCETGCGVFSNVNINDISLDLYVFEDNYGDLVSGAVAIFIHSHGDDSDKSISIFNCEFTDKIAIISCAMYIVTLLLFIKIIWKPEESIDVIHHIIPLKLSNFNIIIEWCIIKITFFN